MGGLGNANEPFFIRKMGVSSRRLVGVIGEIVGK